MTFLLWRISIIDIRERRIPNNYVYPALFLLLIYLRIISSAFDIQPNYARSLFGLGFAFLVFLSLHAISPHGIGLGDVKLSAIIGLVLGWYSYEALFYGLVAMFVISALFSLVLIIKSPSFIRSSIPFAPFMTLGYLAGLALR